MKLSRLLPCLLAFCLLFSFVSCRRTALVALPENLVAAYQKRENAALSESEQAKREEGCNHKKFFRGFAFHFRFLSSGGVFRIQKDRRSRHLRSFLQVIFRFSAC